MTKTEEELSKKLLNTQAELLHLQAKHVLLQERVDKLEAYVMAVMIARKK